METRFKDSQLAIVDDVLVAEQFAQVWSAMQETRYDSVHASERLSVFRVLDGQPLRGGDFNRFVRPVSEFLPDATDPSLLSELRISPLERQTVRIADKSRSDGGLPAVDSFEIDDGSVSAKVEDVFSNAEVASAPSLFS